MTRPRLLDLFCGQGGAGYGYHLAGFDVTGVDLDPEARRHHWAPCSVHTGDALEALDNLLETGDDQFDVIHASPPCQAYTTMSNRHRGQGGKADEHLELIDEVRDRLIAYGKPYVIENVLGAKRAMRSPFLLHGGMFGLGVYRPRLFECSELILGVPRAAVPEDPVGVYGKFDGRRLWSRADGSKLVAAKSLDEARAAMGIGWMNDRGLAESIPPAFTEWIGSRLLEQLQLEVVA